MTHYLRVRVVMWGKMAQKEGLLQGVRQITKSGKKLTIGLSR